MHFEAIAKLVDEYTYTVVWSKEDDAFIGQCKEFPSVRVHDEFLKGALEEIIFAVQAAASDLVEKNEKLPKPIGYKRGES